MITQLFGNYLVKNKFISNEQYEKVIRLQKKIRVRLGLIAVSEKMMTSEQSEEINQLQQVMDKKFGDIAISKGYLTTEQLEALLKLQGNQYHTFAQAVTDQGYLTIVELEKAFERFADTLGVIPDNIGVLKSDDSDLIVPLFLPEQCSDYQINHITMAVRTLLRLIDNDAYVGQATTTSEIITEGIAVQALDGEMEMALGFAGENDSLLDLAATFAREEFEVVDLDALDSVAEFINCINGMYATKVSPKLAIDMLPPEYKEGATVARGRRLLRLPIFIKGKELVLISSCDEIIRL